MSELPHCSSDQVVNALRRAGFEAARRSKGSHQAFRRREGDRTIVAIVVLGKSQIPRGTLRNILRQARLTDEEFLALLS